MFCLKLRNSWVLFSKPQLVKRIKSNWSYRIIHKPIDYIDANSASCHAIIRTGASSVQISVRKANGTAGTLHYATGSRAIARLFIERIR